MSFDRKGEQMAINYNKLWKLLIDRNMKKTDLIAKAQISSNVLAHLSKNESVSLENIEKICKCLHCNISEILDITEDTENE